jgi:hypothetical protein
VPVLDSIEELRWKGPRANFEEYAQRLKAAGLLERVAAVKVSHSS